MIATLFDFDGVLVDSEPVHLAAFRDVLAPRGIAITDAEYQATLLGLDDVGVFRAVLAAHGLPSDDAAVHALVVAKKPAFMARFSAELRIFAGAAEIVRRRAARGTVGIVSGALKEEIRFGLSRMGVLDRVAFIVPAEACTACKPDPEGYRLALAELARRGEASARAVVVEDSLAGIEAAKGAGLRCAAVAHTYDAASLAGAGADVVAKTIAELSDALLDGGAA